MAQGIARPIVPQRCKGRTYSDEWAGANAACVGVTVGHQSFKEKGQDSSAASARGLAAMAETEP